MLAVSFFIICFTGNLAGAQWSITEVDSNGNVGQYTSLALDSSNQAHVSYYGNSALKYAWCDSGCESLCDWHTIVVDSNGDVGRYTALALDVSNNPHISYFGNSALNYAWCAAGCEIPVNWTRVTVDTPGAGWDTSLALDSSGNPHISYYKFSTGALKYAWCAAGCDIPDNWTTVTVDSGGDVGEFTSLALDSSNNPRISYYDSDSVRLKYAWCDGGCDTPANWNRIPVNSAGAGGQYTSLALDSSGNPRISYYGTTDLKYAWCDVDCATTANWNAETVDDADNVGWYSSLALDSSDTPHVSYYDLTNQDLKYAYRDGSTWQKEAVDGTAPVLNVGQHTSLALDSSNNPSISYFNVTNQDLRVTTIFTGGTDQDRDCIPDDQDNCPETPNGPDGGTCSTGTSGNPCTIAGPNESECGNDGFCSMNQEDTYPPGGNGIGDACDCESDFDCDGDVDSFDIAAFLADFGRGFYEHPCESGNPCNGDFICDGDVDAFDMVTFLDDFGRGLL